MSLWLAIVLGLVQGITEFLPVSSTAHLRITPTLLGHADPGAAFDAVVQLGTLAAVIVYFARDLSKMLAGMARAPGGAAAREAWLVGVGTLPIGVAGLVLEDYVTGPWRSLWVIAAALAGVAVLMVVVERHAAARGAHTGAVLADVGYASALIIGVAQACALVPGVSRSGATLTCALLVGLARPEAARFSFLLSIPAIGAAGVFQLPEALAELGASGASPWPLAVATLVAGASGYAAIAWLMRFLRTRTLVPFAVYRVLLAGLLVALVGAGVISAHEPTPAAAHEAPP
jgi:undecaprenyl-diphosphatase